MNDHTQPLFIQLLQDGERLIFLPEVGVHPRKEPTRSVDPRFALKLAGNFQCLLSTARACVHQSCYSLGGRVIR